MRLSHSNARKLDSAIRQERIKKIGIGGAAAVGVIALAAVFNAWRMSHADPTIDVRPVPATVATHDVTRAGRRGYVFHATLGDGQSVEAFAASGLAPPVGTHVVLGAHKHQSGKLTYDLISVAQ